MYGHHTPSLVIPCWTQNTWDQEERGWEGPGPARWGHSAEVGSREKGDLSNYKLCPTEVGVGAVVMSFWTGSISETFTEAFFVCGPHWTLVIEKDQIQSSF